MPSVAIIMGTRPEAIKLQPVAAALRQDAAFDVVTIATGQHTDLFSDTARSLGLAPDITLSVHRGRDLNTLSASLLENLGARLQSLRPDLVIVQGDTQSAVMGALAAGFARIAIAHVEAGLRSGNPDAPFPEELNRRLIARAARIHFAPTPGALDNLLREGVPPDQIAVTGNTVIDALSHHLPEPPRRPGRGGGSNRPLLLATAHRRESWDGGMSRIAEALVNIARRDIADILFILPAAPGPRAVMARHLAGLAGVTLSNPLPYDAFLGQLARADVVVTDSGGIQEEAAALGIPAVILRHESDRPESLHGGDNAASTAILAGTDVQAISDAVDRLLRLPRRRMRSLRRNPFGDGQAARRIALALRRWFAGSRPLLLWHEEFRPERP